MPRKKMHHSTKAAGRPATSSASAVSRIEKKLSKAVSGLKQQYQKGRASLEKLMVRAETKLAKAQTGFEKAQAKSNKQRVKTLKATISALKTELKAHQAILSGYHKEYQKLLAESAPEQSTDVKKTRQTKQSKKAKAGRRGRPPKASSNQTASRYSENVGSSVEETEMEEAERV